VMTVRLLGVDVPEDGSADVHPTRAERRVFSEVVALAERYGRSVHLLVVPAHDVFDAIVSTCGVMFASRPEAAAAELARVVRPGGRIALTTWTSDGNLFKMFQVMKAYMPPPAAPAPPSPFEWGNTDRIRQLLGEYFELKFERAVSYYREPSADAAWETFSTSYGPTKTLAESLDPSRRQAFRADFVAFHAGFPTALGICVPREYWLTVGIRK